MQLCEAGVAAVDGKLADQAPVAVLLVPIHRDLLAQQQLGQVLARRPIEVLAPLRGVDAIEADLVLDAAFVAHYQAVTVGKINDLAVEYGCLRARCKLQQRRQREQPYGWR